jgi:GH24 family phage-related lysozyme (muramidase)
MGKIRLVDFFRYYKDTPNQQAAVEILEEMAPVTLMVDNSTWVLKFREPEPVPESVVPAAALDIIASFEGFVPTVYDDGVGVATIGYGSTFYLDGRRVAWGDPAITEPEARKMMESICEKDFWNVIKNTIPFWEEMSDGQRSALCSFSYNLGSHFFGNSGFSTISACLIDKAWDEVPAALMLYVMPGTNVEAGLRRRREAEGKLWMT